MYFAPLSTFLLVPILGLLSLATPFMSSMDFHTSLEFAQWTMQRYSQVKLSPEKHVANVLKSWASQRPLELHIDTFALHVQEMLRTCIFLVLCGLKFVFLLRDSIGSS